MTLRRSLTAGTALIVCASMLSGCNTLRRISEIGQEPPISKIENPVQSRNYSPVTLPMPRPQARMYQSNSLWRPGARAFFKDQRANRIGDILTVNITINDEAEIKNRTNRSRSANEGAGLNNLLGYEASLDRILPQAVNAGDLVDVESNSSTTGDGSVNREESINLTVAAIVGQKLPNGNLVIFGRQEVRVNYEVRELTITGVVRPEDITSDNTITHTQIAEARISYGGRGVLSDIQQPRYGQQIYDILFPF